MRRLNLYGSYANCKGRGPGDGRHAAISHGIRTKASHSSDAQAIEPRQAYSRVCAVSSSVLKGPASSMSMSCGVLVVAVDYAFAQRCLLASRPAVILEPSPSRKLLVGRYDFCPHNDCDGQETPDWRKCLAPQRDKTDTKWFCIIVTTS